MQWPDEAEGNYAHLQDVCQYISYGIRRMLDGSPFWTVLKLASQLEEELFPQLSFLKDLQEAMSAVQRNQTSEDAFEKTFSLGPNGLGPVIDLLKQINALLSLNSFPMSVEEQNTLKGIINPQAQLLGLLIQHLRNTRDRAYYDPTAVSSLRVLLRDEGHRLGVTAMFPFTHFLPLNSQNLGGRRR